MAYKLAGILARWYAGVMDEPEVVEHKVTFRMTAELHLRLKLVAVRERKSVQEILNGLVEVYVQRREMES